ncbi:hypothetical protein [uncultured Paludibaculum sp.]|uniref:hypothetical protein n=1 Tax=uncultured Paludibaculum sp. TaxID=1765020 RepID=UPI002AAADD0B|nr:hypothetical protein [uncultured Paludibaculum sp.]
MGEHDHLSSEDLNAEVQRRLAEGKPVGRLIDSLHSRGESTSEYQSRRTSSDVAAHVRWKSYQGKAAPEETEELGRRAQADSRRTPASGEHDHLSSEQLHAEVQRRLAEGKPVGRLIDTLHGRGESTAEYQAQRTSDDIEAHIRWKSNQGQAAREETEELEGRKYRESVPRGQKPARAARPWWKFW